MYVIEWVTKTVNRDGKNLRHLRSQNINLFQSFMYLWTFNLLFICPKLCQLTTTCLLLMKQKLYALDALFHWKVSVVREWPIYPAELQLNKANTSDKDTSFFDLNIKVIGSDIHTSVYDKRDDFGFPIVNFSWLSGDALRLPTYGIYILQLVIFARCCTVDLDFYSKNIHLTFKLLTQGYKYHKLRKTFRQFFRLYSELLSKFGDISFQELNAFDDDSMT